MQNDKELLNIDLGFLDEVKPIVAKTHSVSKYKFNWRNILVIVGIVGGLFVWGSMSDNNSSPRRTPSSYTPQATDNDATVSNGQFRCSRYDSQQADTLSPKNEFQMKNEEQELQKRSQELDSLKRRINMSSVTASSDQYSIDRYNGLIDSYNAKVTRFKADHEAYEGRITSFNASVEAHNNYLIAHCRRAY